MKTKIFEIAVLLMLAGCVSVNETDPCALDEAIGEGFAHIIKDHQSRIYSIVWHYRANEKWPDTREELVAFIELHNHISAAISTVMESEGTFLAFLISKRGNPSCQ